MPGKALFKYENETLTIQNAEVHQDSRRMKFDEIYLDALLIHLLGCLKLRFWFLSNCLAEWLVRSKSI